MLDFLLLLVWYSAARVSDWVPVQKPLYLRVKWPGKPEKTRLAVNHSRCDLVDKSVLSRSARCGCWWWKDQTTEGLKKATQEGVCSVVVEQTTSVQNGRFNAECNWSQVFGDKSVVGLLQRVERWVSCSVQSIGVERLHDQAIMELQRRCLKQRFPTTL